MRRTAFIMLLLVILLPLTKTSDEKEETSHSGSDQSVIEMQSVSEEMISNDKEEGHSRVTINVEDLTADVKDDHGNSQENILSEQPQNIVNSDNDDSISDPISVESDNIKKQTSAENEVLPTECATDIISDQISPVIEMIIKEQEQSEKQPKAENNDNSNLVTSTHENEKKGTLDVASETEEIINSDNDESHGGTSTKKQRYFPLLFTFGSMFTSFLAEFGEVSGSSESSSSNSSTVKNATSEDGLALSLNTTSNSTDQGKKTRFQCALHVKNSTSELNETALVKVINSTELLEILNFSKNQKSAASPCVVVMFYTQWCHFSARAAPQYNALARAFPQLDVLAVDTSHFSYLNAKFGTVAVPNIMIFHSRSAVRFNHTTRDLDHFIKFVHNNTGLDPVSSVAVLPEDFEGPLPSTVVQGRDWLLWLAWAFILVCSIYMFFFSLYGQAVIMKLRVLWAEHQHIE